MTPAKVVLLIVALIAAVSAQIGRKGSNTISYHIYGNGQISGACDFSSPVSKYSGMITANTLGLECFACVRMKHATTGKQIHVTVVDTGGKGFDLNEPAFKQMCGQQGINDGSCPITWEVVAHSNCPGNPKAGGAAPKPTTPGTKPPAGGAAGSRCGKTWALANSQCNNQKCTTTCPKGQTCFAGVKACPAKAEGDQDTVLPENDGQITTIAASDDDSNPDPDGQINDVAVAEEDTIILEEGVNDPESASAVGDVPTVSDVSAQPTQSMSSTSSSSAAAAPQWAVAMIVVACLLVVALVVVVVLVALLLRK